MCILPKKLLQLFCDRTSILVVFFCIFILFNFLFFSLFLPFVKGIRILLRDVIHFSTIKNMALAAEKRRRSIEKNGFLSRNLVLPIRFRPICALHAALLCRSARSPPRRFVLPGFSGNYCQRMYIRGIFQAEKSPFQGRPPIPPPQPSAPQIGCEARPPPCGAPRRPVVPAAAVLDIVCKRQEYGTAVAALRPVRRHSGLQCRRKLKPQHAVDPDEPRLLIAGAACAEMLSPSPAGSTSAAQGLPSRAAVLKALRRSRRRTMRAG